MVHTPKHTSAEAVHMSAPLVNWRYGTEPEAPYYATVFSSLKHDPRPGYAAMDDATMKAAEQLDGYLGHQVVHNGDRSLFIAYWRDKASIAVWSAHPLHQAAKREGKASWYDAYRFEICLVERAAGFVR